MLTRLCALSIVFVCSTFATVPRPVESAQTWNTLVIGDSIACAAAPNLHAYNLSVDCQTGRQWSFSYRANFGEGDHIVVSGISEATQLRERGSLPPTVVVELGTNGPITNADVRSMLWILRGCRVYLVTTFALPGSNASRWTGGVNAVLWWAHWTYHVPLILWSRAVKPSLIDNRDGLGVHPTPAGAAVFARLIAHAVGAS